MPRRVSDPFAMPGWTLLLAVLLAVLLAAGTMAPPDLVAAAETALAERYPEEAHRLRVRLVRTGGDVSAEAVRLAFPPDAALPRAHTQVDVLAQGPQGWTKTGWALLYVAQYDSVVVARRSVGRDEAVAPEDLTIAWVETTRFHGEPLTAAAYRALGPAYFARRPLREGRPLRRDDLRPPFAAETGAGVVLHYRRGTLALELPCQAREPGYAGEAVRLYCPETRTTYRARLTAPGHAEWVETL